MSVPSRSWRWRSATAREAGAARVDHDQRARRAPCAARMRRADDGVVLGRVGADDQHAVGAVDVGDRVRHRARAERAAEPGDRRRVADARAVVDVVRAEHGARELHRGEVVLVGRARARDRRRRRPGPPSRARVAQRVGRRRERRPPTTPARAARRGARAASSAAPGRRRNFSAFQPLAQSWPRDTGWSAQRADVGHAAVLDAEHHAAADAAERAHGRHCAHRPISRARRRARAASGPWGAG